MKDSISLMKSAAKHASQLVWCAVDLRKNTRAGSKAQLEAELLLRYAEAVQCIVSLISDDMAAEELDFKLRMSDAYGKNTHD